jgi:hypothetical protein
VVKKRHVGGIVEATRFDAMRQELFRVSDTSFGERHRLVLLIDDVVAGRFEAVAVFGFDLPLVHLALFELGDDLVDFVIEIGRGLCRA